MKIHLFPHNLILFIDTSSCNALQTSSYFSHASCFYNGWLIIVINEERAVDSSFGGKTGDYVADMQFMYESNTNNGGLPPS